jgi:hypothetical protein
VEVLMAEVEIELPEPKISIRFTIEELDWSFDNVGQEKFFLVEGVKSPRTGITKNLRIKVVAEEPA